MQADSLSYQVNIAAFKSIGKPVQGACSRNDKHGAIGIHRGIIAFLFTHTEYAIGVNANILDKFSQGVKK
jgi:hypothetical protein